MIPKTIHYCWFGGNPKPEIIEKCIASWHKYCPDYEIIEWNESNYDVNAHPYTRKAYAEERWAFISDVARLEILYQHGGVYMDTDVEILCPHALDFCQNYQRVLPFENGRNVNTGMFVSAEVNDPVLKALLSPYIEFNGETLNYTVNTQMNRPILRSVFPTLKWNNCNQTIDGTRFLSTSEYEKYFKHYGTRSWLKDFPEYKLHKVSKFVLKLRNPDIFEALEKSKLGRKIEPIYTFCVYDLFDLGPVVYVKRLFIKLKKALKRN